MSFSLFNSQVKETTTAAPAGDGLVYVSAHYLIQLRHAARSLPLKSAKVRALQSGQYYSPFRGRGMEFDEVRPYQPGDDVRTLDWRVTARTGKAHTKLFREERERAVYVWVDYRNPMFFATRGVFKSVLASELAALLCWSAHHQRDRVGGLLFSENQHHELKPGSGKTSVLHLLQLMSQMSMKKMNSARDSRSQTSNEVEQTHQQVVYQALSRLRRVAKPGSLIFMISDFRGFDSQAESVLTQIARNNNIVVVFIHDPLEEQLPHNGIYRIGDGQQVLPIDTSDANFRVEYQQSFVNKEQALELVCKRHSLNFLSFSTQDEPLDGLRRYLYLTR